MKNILFLFFIGVFLVACGSDKKKDGANLNSGEFDALFSGYVGNYRVVGCDASADRKDECAFQTAEIALATDEEDGARLLNLKSIGEFDDGTGAKVLRSTTWALAASIMLTANCVTSLGRQVCFSAKYPGAWWETSLQKAGNAMTILDRGYMPERGESSLVLQLEAI